MITLITGLPGTGKTALAVKMALEEFRGRPLFVCGVKDLRIEHSVTPPLQEWTTWIEDPTYVNGKKLCFAFPERSVILVDEAQSIYRPRSSMSKVPDHVAAFETHRHEQIDFLLLTQKASLIEANLRGLVGRHIHIEDTILGRYLYEWPKLGDPESKASRELAARQRYRPPRKVFKLYTSAKGHTKTRRRISRLWFLFVGAVVALLWLVMSLWDTFAPSLQSSVVSPSKGAPAPTKEAPAAPKAKDPLGDYIRAREPRVPGLAYTAAVYDGVTAPKQAPFPAACVASSKRCACWSDQGTTLHVPESLCRTIVANGLYRAWEDRKAAEVKKDTSTEKPSRSRQDRRHDDELEGVTPGLPDREPLRLSPGFHSGDRRQELAPDLGPPRQKYPPGGAPTLSPRMSTG